MLKFNEPCKYRFQPTELVDIAKRQAQLMNDKLAQEESFEQIKADHKSKITRIETDVSDCTRRITSGFEIRATEVLVLKFRPNAEQAMHVRLDSGRVLRIRKLEADEKQITLTETAPNPYVFEADLTMDGDGDVLDIQSDIQLTKPEAEALAQLVKLRPARRKIADGKK